MTGVYGNVCIAVSAAAGVCVHLWQRLHDSIQQSSHPCGHLQKFEHCRERQRGREREQLLETQEGTSQPNSNEWTCAPPRAILRTLMILMMVGFMGSAAFIFSSSSAMPMMDRATIAISSWFHLNKSTDIFSVLWSLTQKHHKPVVTLPGCVSFTCLWRTSGCRTPPIWAEPRWRRYTWTRSYSTSAPPLSTADRPTYRDTSTVTSWWLIILTLQEKNHNLLFFSNVFWLLIHLPVLN